MVSGKALTRVRAIRAGLIAIPVIAVLGYLFLVPADGSQRITFAGPVSGLMSNVSATTCGADAGNSNSRHVTLVGDVGSSTSQVIDMVFLNNGGADAIGAGTYDVSFNPDIAGPNPRTVAVHVGRVGHTATPGDVIGTVTLNSDLRSGSIDLTRPVDTIGGTATRIAGNWRC